MRKIDFMTVGGLILGFGLIIGSIAISGSIMGYIDLPSILITVFGSFSALLISYNTNDIKNALGVAKNALFEKETNFPGLIQSFVALSGKARREGLLTLEEEIDSLQDPFFERGVQLIVDGIEPEVIREILETDLFYTEERHAEGQNIFKTWATAGPAFGMMGTLIGLVQMLRDLDDPSKIGPAMAIALLTTFYGVLLANLVLLPIAGKLDLNNKKEVMEKQIIIEGILSIQSGINPRILEDKLKTFLPPKFRNIQEKLDMDNRERGVQVDAS